MKAYLISRNDGSLEAAVHPVPVCSRSSDRQYETHRRAKSNIGLGFPCAGENEPCVRNNRLTVKGLQQRSGPLLWNRRGVEERKQEMRCVLPTPPSSQTQGSAPSSRKFPFLTRSPSLQLTLGKGFWVSVLGCMKIPLL